MLAMLTWVVVSAAPGVDCIPAPASVRALGDDAVAAFQDSIAQTIRHPSVPTFQSAPVEARPLLAYLFISAQDPQGSYDLVRWAMADAFSTASGSTRPAGDVFAQWRLEPKVFEAVRTALQSGCVQRKQRLTCGKGALKLVFERGAKCWSWTAATP